MRTKLVLASTLHGVCMHLLGNAKLSRVDAQTVSAVLIGANLRGVHSHGIARLPHYLARLQNGSILARPKIHFRRNSHSTGTLDGGHGLGHVVMQRAMMEAVALAKKSGSGWVSVRNSSHCGALFHFGRLASKRGMIGFALTHVDPMVVPHGAKKAYGTNPICICAQGLREELCLDMATSMIPWNIVQNARIENIPLAPGYALDHRGRGTTNPQRVAALLPMGAHRGSGLGLMIDLLCAMLSGSPNGPHIPAMYGDLKKHRRLGGLVGALNISSFIRRKDFQRRVDGMAREIRRLPPASGVRRVLTPGQKEIESERTHLRQGIPIGLQTLAELKRLLEGSPRCPSALVRALS